MMQAFDRYTADREAGIEYVCHRNGRRILNYRKGWETALRAAGLPHFPMYNIRHVAASEMLAAGADLAAVSAQLGHSNAHTTGTFYAHVTAGSQQRAATLLPPIECHVQTPVQVQYRYSKKGQTMSLTL
jgi:integrase